MGRPSAFNVKQLYMQLASHFGERGFKWNRELNEYRLPFDGGHQVISIQRQEGPIEHSLNITFGVRNEIVESTLQPFLPHYSPSNSITAALQMQSFLNDTELFQFKKANTQKSIHCIMRFFEEDGYQMMRDLKDIHHVENLYNQHATIPTSICTDSTARCFRGIVLARMTNNPKWNDIHKTFLNHLENSPQSSDVFHHYMRLIEYLNGFGFN